MKKINLSHSEQRLLLLLLSLLCIAVSYFLIFQNTTKKAAEIETQNEERRAQVAQLEQMVGQQGIVEQQIEENKATIEEILAQYPSDMTTEKAIAMVQEVENNTNMHVSTISFLMENYIGDINSLGSAATPVEGEEGTDAQATDAVAVPADANVGYYASLSMNYDASYAEFKNMITYFDRMKDRATIPTNSARYDNETNRITGVMTVNLFYLTNTGKEYLNPNINGIGNGTNNIFESSGVRNNATLQSEVGINEAE